MEKYFIEEFKTFFETLNDFEKKLILWCSVSNYECPEEYFKLVFDSVELENKSALCDNYCDKFYYLEKKQLKIFDKNEAKYLKKELVELDGTLLCDIVSSSLKTHKIFN